MSVYEEPTPSADSVLSQLERFVDHNWDPFDTNPDSLVREFLGIVKAMGTQEQAIKARVAQELEWAKARDVGPAGFPHWTGFLAELSPWGPSRSNDYIRLAKLELVLAAVANNEIDLTLATRAPKLLGDDASPDAQRKWLSEARCETPPHWHRACMDVLTGDEMYRVLQAEELSEVLMGWNATRSAKHAFLLDCLEQKLTGEQILERARATPPKPDRLGKDVPEWKHDPAKSLLGPWIAPKDIVESVERLRALGRLLDWRDVLLGQAYFLIKFHALWTSFEDCTCVEDLCIQHLEIPQHTFQRCARTGLAAFQHEGVTAEIKAGRVPLDKAIFAMDRSADDRTLASWLELVRRLGRVELQHGQRRHDDINMLREYTPAVEMARQVESIVEKAKEGGMSAAADEASRIGGTAGRIAEHLLAKGATTGVLGVAVRDDENRRSPRPDPGFLFAPPKLVEAADYLLAQVKLPPVYGPKQIVLHDMRTCQNPRCRRPTIRLHPHHLDPQKNGINHDPSNLLGLCPGCHLRGVHTSNWMTAVRIDDWIVFTWLDGSAVLMYSPVSWVRAKLRKAK